MERRSRGELAVKRTRRWTKASAIRVPKFNPECLLETSSIMSVKVRWNRDAQANFLALLVACLITATLWAATDPFVGDWKLNPSNTKLVDHMKVESLGGNKYAFDFGGGPEKIAVDGTDQQAVQGTMLSVTAAGPDSWKVVRKKDGRVLLAAIWKLSPDGNTLTDNYTEFAPDGSPSTVNYSYQRTAAGPGFAGTWESPMPITSSYVLQIRAYEGTGVFVHPQLSAKYAKPEI